MAKRAFPVAALISEDDALQVLTRKDGKGAYSDPWRGRLLDEEQHVELSS